LPGRGVDRYNLSMPDRRDPPSAPASDAASGRSVVIDGIPALDRFAACIAAVARVGDVFALAGELGAGKTAFARSFISALASREGAAPPADVPSPTFTLMQEYDIGLVRVFHFDLYRLKKPDEALELGIEDACAEGIALIEWPERLGPYLPRDRVDLHLTILDDGRRRADLAPRGRAVDRYGSVQ
jgi:tRNA threonylcarbamoyladenosine biosynthesis protein TsaE